MRGKQELLNELLLMADCDTRINANVSELSEKCGLTISKTRKYLDALQNKSKIRMSTVGKDMHGYENLNIDLLV